MTRHNSESSTERPDISGGAPSSPSLSRRSTGNNPEAHRERRDSKLGHMVDTIRTALSQEQAKLFGDKNAQHHRKYQSTVEERLEKLRQQDETQRERVEEEIRSDSEADESVSPAVEARARSDLDENNMGLTSHERARSDSWGWPGLGTYAAGSEDATNTKRKSSFKNTRDKMHDIEPKLEAATYEAIDNAAESDSFGWPGLGDFPPPRK
ncbi:hypothetical protein A1O1_08148 [Capronia coronata CBS 617.96]|uniref:Uncharacterized protein n=1 Tax=Capronia coronata CBS 617.96 TaxID=1182541 RepID=W9YIF4_9EURO|nr:uncharacterized protein A1O1_08148 [Capronia coronata CBS 617.96]EXJ82079.1 hypothetical protein A1O1_08148 [Capronia coronata CBS 617.96]